MELSPALQEYLKMYKSISEKNKNMILIMD